MSLMSVSSVWPLLVIMSTNERCSVVSIIDLTALKAAQAEVARQREALRQGEKLTALGSLLAGVAHELNNPLSIVTGYAEILRDLAPDEGTRERALEIYETIAQGRRGAGGHRRPPPMCVSLPLSRQLAGG